MEIQTLTHYDVLQCLPDRDPDAHKGDFGRLLLLCGSRGYTGAAALAAMGALRSGTGLVYLGVPESIYAIEAMKLTEPVVFPLPDTGGKFGRESIPEIMKRLDAVDAVLIGPGLGRSQDTYLVTKAVLENCRCPVVVDADGINALAGHMDILRERHDPTVLTPHAGELARIWPWEGQDRIAKASAFARETGTVLVLKGHETVITDGDKCYVNHTGNPGMAVGGSGDVLAGIIAGLICQKLAPLQAAACGVWVHGRAGDVCAEQIGQYGMLPSDMLEVLPRLLK